LGFGQVDKKKWMRLNYRYKFKLRSTDMLSIFINLIFVSGFCFLLIVCLEYAIYLWENQKMNDLTKDIPTSQSPYDSGVKRSFSSEDYSNDKTNSTSPNMKFNINNKYFERSLVLVQSQDYKGWLEKAAEISKKVANNVGYYSKKAFKYVINLSKSGNNFPDQEEKHIKSEQSASKINETVEKITQINDTDNNVELSKTTNDKPNFFNNHDSHKNYNLDESNSESHDLPANNVVKADTNQGATLNLAVDDKPAKDTTTYDKIEKSILLKLQETGLNHYDIWLELGHFYQKYDEKEKAKEIFAMVMKHAEGRDKDLARDGLIALS
jgi:hypothetical protein